MPKRKHELSLMEIFKSYSPVQMSNGQIRMECPFRENHTDGSGRMSFFVSPDINAYHCFSCGAKGNLVRLLTTRFKVTYFEAVGLVRFTEYRKKKVEFDLDVMWDFHKSPEEFMHRGYSKDTLEHFRVGMTDTGEILIPYYKDFTQIVNYSDVISYNLQKGMCVLMDKHNHILASYPADKKIRKAISNIVECSVCHNFSPP